MKILFIGDNLVKGSIGVNWVKWLGVKNPTWTVENAGTNGVTLYQAKQRLDKIIPGSDYDIIFFKAGLNDLLIPEMVERKFPFKQHFQHTNLDAKPCATAEQFAEKYLDAILEIKSKTDATVILSTLGCISENLELPINKKRRSFNDVIRDVAIETGCALVDAGAVFDGYLRRCRTRNYFMNGFLNTVILDQFHCRLMGGPDQLSKKRGLHLTIDGVHLNSRGANLFRDETERQIKSLISSCSHDQKEQISSLRTL